MYSTQFFLQIYCHFKNKKIEKKEENRKCDTSACAVKKMGVALVNIIPTLVYQKQK